jgi:hypothetical protein
VQARCTGFLSLVTQIQGLAQIHSKKWRNLRGRALHEPKRAGRDERRIALPSFALTPLALCGCSVVDQGPDSFLFPRRAGID